MDHHEIDISSTLGSNKKGNGLFKLWNLMATFIACPRRLLPMMPSFHIPILITGLATNSFFLFPFCKKSLICLGGKSILIYCSLPFLTEISSSPFQALEELFELAWHPSRHPTCLVHCFQSNKDSVRCAALIAEVIGHCQEPMAQALIVRL